ncbi:hypothetical protein QYS49_34770 [Marivirga salinae]|uniref:Uncharacterized protein n=1 Tax=Marivirga salinarum TaxID=3059078 RepID=A0AA51NEJ2_9BACT|nr:hypothetical protein [Marivirga sp. BDSF4-3]WMN12836.1 hypothetical protein QYS49_34770 [Marivirga sp. BDSF4-3]
MRNVLFMISVLVIFSSCGEDLIEFTPTEKFNSIFDNPSEGLNYVPLDAIETDDGGFLVLSQLANESIFILKISNRGDFQWSRQMEPQFVKAVANLIRQGDNYYFIGSTLPDYTSTLFEINDLEQTIQAVRTYDSYRNPLAFNNLTPESFLLLTYNDTTGTVLSKILDGFAMEWARKFDNIENADQKLETFQNSNRTNFFVGSYNSGSIIYFNSLRDQGMNLTYTDDQGIETGKIRSSQRDMINSVTPIQSGLIAINYTFRNQAYFISDYQPIANDSINLQILGGEILQDRLSIQNAKSASISVGAVSYIVNAYSTLDGRIKLNFFNSQTGEQVAIKYLGGIDPLEVVEIIPTADEGMAILSRITIAGAKERINLMKIPKDEILEIL